MEMDEKYVVIVNEVISNHFLGDIAFSILGKLPLKSLKRFGCVRKSWTVLFENSHFMSLYRKNFTNTSLLLKQHETLPDEKDNTLLYLLSGESVENRVSLDSPPPFQDLNNYFGLGSSANGVLCLDGPKIVLWNPDTKEFKIVPHSPFVDYGPLYRDPYPILCVFGYDPVRDDYKVIRYVLFFQFDLDEYDRYGMTYNGTCDEDIDLMPLWEIYSLRSNSWKKLDFEMHVDTCPSVRGHQTYLEGVCHWWGFKESPYVSCLVSFVMSNEVFFTTPMPSYIGAVMSNEVHLGIVNGYVAFIFNRTEKTTFHISILGELGVKESWTKLFVIGSFPCVEKLIGLGNNGNLFFKTKDGELAWFDWSTQMIVELGIKDPREHSQVVIYEENLESLIHIGLVK